MKDEDPRISRRKYFLFNSHGKVSSVGVHMFSKYIICHFRYLIGLGCSFTEDTNNVTEV
jgi:hypothetical protein